MKISLNKTLFSLFYGLIFVAAIGRIQYSATTIALWINIYRASVYLIILIGIIYIIYRHRFKYNKTVILLTVMVLYEAFISIYRYRRINLTLFNEFIIDVLAWPLIFILTYNFTRDMGVPQSLKKISICGVSAILIITAVNISNMSAIGINPAVGGVGFCVAVLPLIYFYFPKRLEKIIAVIILLIVMLSTKRSSFLAVLIGIFVYYLSDAIIQEMPRKKFNKMFSVMLLVVIIAIVGIYMLGNSDLEIIQEFTSDDETLSGRTLLWERILTNYNSLSFGEKLFGSGMHAVKYKYNPYGLGWYAHNSFIETLYDYGIVGLSILIAFIVVIIKKTLEMNSRKSIVAPIMSATIPSMLLFASSSYFFEIGQTMLFYSFIWSLCITIFDQGLLVHKTSVPEKKQKRGHQNLLVTDGMTGGK